MKTPHPVILASARASCVAIGVAFLLLAAQAIAADGAGEAFFETKVRPLLSQRCLECHGEKKQEGGLRLDSKNGWQTGGDSGTALVPGKPEASLLIKAVSYVEKDLQMPPTKQLPADEVALLREWVRQGAPDPRLNAAAIAKPENDEWAATFKSRLDWWSLHPPRATQPPVVQDAAWSREQVDRFVRASLDQAGLLPAPPAEPEVLLRRLTFVLTGLPPTREQRAGFFDDCQHDVLAACEKLVDQLLASPHFGERFARHWMDVVRYADTYGYEWDNPAKGSWEYRDYLIRAFNQDVTFDQMVREQIAGDLLPAPRINQELAVNESIIGPMFYHLGEHRHGSSRVISGVHQDMVNNKIDALSKTFLATSVACARCHNHKLEAVSQRDYYALAAMIMTPRWTARVLDAPGKNDAAIVRLKELRGEIRRELATEWLNTATAVDAWSPAQLAKAIDAKEAAGLKPDDVAYPISQFLIGEVDVPKRWKEQELKWRETRKQRIAANATFKTLADFHDAKLPDGWVLDGDGMKHGYVDDGTPLVALAGESVIDRLLPRGYHTHALSSKLPGAMRMPPQQNVPGKTVSVQLAGGEYGGYLIVDENAFQPETFGFLKSAEPAWTAFAGAPPKNGITQVTVEFATASLNPNFPPRTGLGAGLPNSDLGYDKRSWVSVTGVVSQDKAGAPQNTLEPFATLYDGAAPEAAAPATREEAGQRTSAWLAGAVRRWCEGRTRPGDLQVLNWLLTKKLLPNQAAAGSPLANLLAEYRRVEQGIAHARTVNSMDERDLVKTTYPLNVRGNVDALGELVPPDSLQMFAGHNRVAESRGSGRLELAESLLAFDHPLTSRVYVNRVWQWLFGTGIVATPDDFGHLGDKPSHPELLDYLAREFMQEGWSTKKLVRRIVLSQTFRQSGTVSDAARGRDPGNRLLHHYPTRRLEAEAIRDALLAVSGRLDPQLYGRPIEPPRAVPDPSKRLFSGPLDGDGRRSIYLKMSIMDPPKFLVGFNLPDLRLPTGRRDVTNVPAQALAMLNDPLVSELAKRWAVELVKKPLPSKEARISAMFVQAFGRVPEETELRRWAAAMNDFATPGNPDTMADTAAWERLAHALFNTKEFIYYR